MKTHRLESLISSFSKLKVIVLGDFFLDLYIHLDRALSELSLETNLEAFQAVDLIGIPGAAGVVTNNLVALGASTTAIAYTGDDGNGYVLRRELNRRGVNTEHLLLSDDRFTPTYTKPMMTEVAGSTVELNRIDIRNRSPNSSDLEDEIIHRMQSAIPDHDGLLVTEQVVDDGCGVLTPRIRSALANLAHEDREKIFIVDSRHFTDRYSDVALKLNLAEAIRAAQVVDPRRNWSQDGDRLKIARECQRFLWERVKKPIFITLGSTGISGCASGHDFYYPGYKTEKPIDIVGAGDSVLAGCGIALCAGASPAEAAYIGNLIGSITIEQIGTTGIAKPEQLLKRHHEYQTQI